MTLYLYKTGAGSPVLEIENVTGYTADQAVTEDGTVYGPFAEDCELSALPDCSQALRAGWRAEHPSAEERMEELENLVAGMIFGGGETA